MDEWKTIRVRSLQVCRRILHQSRVFSIANRAATARSFLQEGIIKDDIVEQSLADYSPKSVSAFGEPVNQ